MEMMTIEETKEEAAEKKSVKDKLISAAIGFGAGCLTTAGICAIAKAYNKKKQKKQAENAEKFNKELAELGLDNILKTGQKI